MTRHEIAGECYTHQHLWNCAKALLTQTETRTPQDGYFMMAGMLTAYFTFEAYLNLVGPRVDQEAWKNERVFFTNEPYRGTEGKLKRICEKLEIKLEPGKRPYQTIKQRKKLRDFLAHGNVQTYGYSLPMKEGEQPDLFRDLDIYNMVTRKKADQALKDTAEFIQFLHNMVHQNTGGGGSSFNALEFPLAFATGVAIR
jgi:hypothetical protein